VTDFLRVADLGDRLGEVVALARRLKDDRSIGAGHLAGRQVGLFFEKPSLRTRVSTEVSIRRLGGDPVVLTAEGIGLGTREAVADVARVLDRMLDAIAMRVFDHRTLEAIALHARTPVVNLLSDRAHPCQALADLATIEDHKPVADSVVTYVGDANNVAVSLAWGVHLMGGEARIAAPPGYRVDPSILPEGVVVFDDPVEAVIGADVVYTDVWTSMGQEAEREARLRAFAGWSVDLALFRRAEPDAVFLHCLPAHRGEEVASEVMEHPRSRVFDQAEYRLHSFSALLLTLL
jgi:ornithine carbamoyltransferase